MAHLPRPVFCVSDGTGITAEALGHSLLTQFEGIEFQQIVEPFVDSVEKARECVDRIAAAKARSVPASRGSIAVAPVRPESQRC